MESQPDPTIHRAYRELLGNAYEQLQMEHITFSGLADAFAPDFDAGWQWQLAALEDAANTAPPATYQPLLVTDAGSALIPVSVWYDRDPLIGPRIARFVAARGASFFVVSYANMSGRGREHFMLHGSDGFTAREAHWSVEYKSFGRRKVWPVETKELPPWDDTFFLSDAAFELRENNSAQS
jgi:hypothetical protein